MDGVVPVVIVISILTVPTAIMRLERIMRPANAGVRARYNNILSGETQRPDIRCMRVTDAWLDRCRSQEVRRRLIDSTWLRQIVMDKRIPFYSHHVRPGR